MFLDRGSERRVSKLKALDRNYQVLDYLYTRPRLTYLARVRNPNKGIPAPSEYPFTTEEYRKAMMADPTGNPYASHEHGAEHGPGAATAPHGATAPEGAAQKAAQQTGGHH